MQNVAYEGGNIKLLGSKHPSIPKSEGTYHTAWLMLE